MTVCTNIYKLTHHPEISGSLFIQIVFMYISKLTHHPEIIQEPNDCLDNKRYKYIGPGSLFIQNSVQYISKLTHHPEILRRNPMTV